MDFNMWHQLYVIVKKERMKRLGEREQGCFYSLIETEVKNRSVKDFVGPIEFHKRD